MLAVEVDKSSENDEQRFFLLLPEHSITIPASLGYFHGEKSKRKKDFRSDIG